MDYSKKEIPILSEEEKNNLPDDHQEQAVEGLYEYLQITKGCSSEEEYSDRLLNIIKAKNPEIFRGI